MPSGAASADHGHVRILIVGSGFGGLGAAIRLDRVGHRDFVVIERGDDVGGTWRDNTYPGATCDVPSQLYSYSFALNPDWSRSFSGQWEIQEYLRRVAKEAGVRDRHVFNCELTQATWRASENSWQVQTSLGDWTADVLIMAIGGLCEPKLPDIPGIESFTGRLFHSARWDHNFEFTGKRVAVIGTGASAIQIVPEIASQVAQLDVYQRTPGWVMPRRDRPISTAEHWIYRHIPASQRTVRSAIYLGREVFALGFAFQPAMLRAAQRMATAHLERQVPSPELRERLTPNFTMGCKRILLSNDWYPALQESNVKLVTDAITEIRPNSIVTADGVERATDAIVVATGFHVTDSPAAERIVGADGRTLAEHWAEGMRAYRGTTVPGFPNYFHLIGPNTALGHSSMVFVIEAQLNYVLDALRRMQQHDLATVEVREDSTAGYNKWIQKRMRRTVWTTGGCASWYQDARGRVTTLWPSFTFNFWRSTRRFDMAAYRSTARDDAAGRA